MTRRAGRSKPGVTRTSPVGHPPIARQASSNRGPAARWIAPSTPPPPASAALAADDRVDPERGDVGDDDLEAGRAEAHQTLAWLFTGTPASVRIAASSPDWNISRVMSQPPTNSPLT